MNSWIWYFIFPSLDNWSFIFIFLQDALADIYRVVLMLERQKQKKYTVGSKKQTAWHQRRRDRRPSREMRCRGRVHSEGGGTETTPTGITSVRISLSAHRSSQSSGENAYLSPIRISWTLKSVTGHHRAHVSTAGKRMLLISGKRWRLPWRCPRQLTALWNTVDPCLRGDVVRCQLEHVTQRQRMLASQWHRL